MNIKTNRLGKDSQSLLNDNIPLDASIRSVKVPQQLKIKLPTGIEFIDDAFGNGFTPSAITLLTDKSEYYLQQILNYKHEDGFVEKFRYGIKNEPKINLTDRLTKQEKFLKNILKDITFDESNSLIKKIADYAKYNDLTENQIFNLKTFVSFLSDEMLVYFWNLISRCQNKDNIIKFHKTFEEKLLQIVNQRKSKEEKIKIYNEPSFDFKNNVNKEYEDEPFFDISKTGKNDYFEDEPRLILKKEYKFKVGNKILSERQFRKLIRHLL